MTFKTFEDVEAYWDSIGCEHKQRKVVCAAIRHKDNKYLVICGPRHYDAVMRRTLDFMQHMNHHDFHDQGFVDQWGIYMSREEARAVAIECGIEPDLKNTLFSEDLY